MVKSGSSKSSKVVKSTSSKSTPDVDKSTNAKTTSDDEQSTIILCLDDENSVVHSDDDEEVIEIVNSARDAVYDDDVARTFIVRALGEVEEKTIQTKSGGTKEEVVLNVDITDASGNDKVIIVWGPPAVHVREFFDGQDPKAVYLIPKPKDLSTIGHPRYVETDASKFLQFVLKPATVSQKKFHEVDEVYSLTTLLPNPRRATLSLCHLILPEVIGWPTKNFLTFKGVLLKQPNEWYTPKAVAYTDANYDFGAKSPVRPLRPHNR